MHTRPHYSFTTEYGKLQETVKEILEKISPIERKPVVEVKIQGENIEVDQIQAQISNLSPQTLRCFWKIISKSADDSSIFLERPTAIDEELFKLASSVLGSEQTANFVIRELLPALTSNQIKEATQIILENFENVKKEKKF